jgi:hypothetical protein
MTVDSSATMGKESLFALDRSVENMMVLGDGLMEEIVN